MNFLRFLNFLSYIFVLLITVQTISIFIYKFKKSNKFNKSNKSSFQIDIHRFKNGKLIKQTRSFDTSQIIFYDDAWRAHWCPYYNDREIFLTPKINEIFHLARSRGIKVIHLHWKGDPSKIDSAYRDRNNAFSKRHVPQNVSDYYPWNQQDNKLYIPGFQDSCIYNDFNNSLYKPRGPTRMDRPNPSISVSEDDYMGKNFKFVCSSIIALDIKTVFLFGMHTNLCILSETMYLELFKNVELIYVDDLLDAGFYYPSTKEKIKSHSQMNSICNRYMEEKHGPGVKGYDLMHGLEKMKPQEQEPEWVLFPEKVNYFRRFYLPLKKLNLK